MIDDRRHDGKQRRAVEDVPRHQHLHEEDPLLYKHGARLNDEDEKEPPRVERRRCLIGDEGADDAEEKTCGESRELHSDRLRHVVARRRDDRADGDEPKLHAVVEEEQDADDAGGNLQRARKLLLLPRAAREHGDEHDLGDHGEGDRAGFGDLAAHGVSRADASCHDGDGKPEAPMNRSVIIAAILFERQPPQDGEKDAERHSKRQHLLHRRHKLLQEHLQHILHLTLAI